MSSIFKVIFFFFIVYIAKTCLYNKFGHTLSSCNFLCGFVCLFVCMSVPLQNSHFQRSKEVLVKSPSTGFGQWLHIFLFQCFPYYVICWSTKIAITWSRSTYKSSKYFLWSSCMLVHRSWRPRLLSASVERFRWTNYHDKIFFVSKNYFIAKKNLHTGDCMKDFFLIKLFFKTTFFVIIFCS